ncbi:MAG: tetratricopeptide repeat protein [Desulfovibrionaceae bacterium]|jgi:predicted negative regulator of RcsB-dependent stress response|nr:tetratricopeptide repeat protein [Desulfovibrionaceae bacterium]
MDAKQPKPGDIAAAELGQVNDDLSPLLKTLKRNLRPILFGVGVVVLVMGAYAGWDIWSANRHASASTELGKILVTTDGAERVKALEGLLSSAPDALRTPILLEIARAAQEQGDNVRAAKAWADVAALGEPALVPLAALGQAEALQGQGKSAEALTVVEAAAANAPEAYKGVLAFRTGVLAEELGDWAKARDAYERMKSLSDSDHEFYDYKIAKFQARLDTKTDTRTDAKSPATPAAPAAPKTESGAKG